MDETHKYKFKAFFWDQFVRPFMFLFNMHQLQIIFLATTIIAFVFKVALLFWFSISVLLVITFFEAFKYYKSGEYLFNYRSRTDKYGQWKKTMKEIRKKKKGEVNETTTEVGPHSDQTRE